jgi:hypothetical protein
MLFRTGGLRGGKKGVFPKITEVWTSSFLEKDKHDGDHDQDISTDILHTYLPSNAMVLNMQLISNVLTTRTVETFATFDSPYVRCEKNPLIHSLEDNASKFKNTMGHVE